ncbi:MAG: acyloxyacyl hydrolase [Rhodospirillaceae bacterium]|nr:acyloxyacyl hydrolase [Rhodospirillaceae bacterium]
MNATKKVRFAPLAGLGMALFVGIGLSVAPAPAMADDPAFISFGGGSYDWNRQKDEGTEFRIEYRHDEKFLGALKPFIAAAATTTDSYFVGAGVLMDIYLGKRIVVTPSFAPHFYSGGNKKLDLDHAVEFRSQLELAYRMDDRSRIGIAVSHYSNASLGDTNPGTESAIIYYSMPLAQVFGN